MDPRTGELYPTITEAYRAGVENPVELVGTPEAVRSISAAVKAQHKAKRKAQRRARRTNRV